MQCWSYGSPSLLVLLRLPTCNRRHSKMQCWPFLQKAQSILLMALLRLHDPGYLLCIKFVGYSPTNLYAAMLWHIGGCLHQAFDLKVNVIWIHGNIACAVARLSDTLQSRALRGVYNPRKAWQMPQLQQQQYLQSNVRSASKRLLCFVPIQ